MSAPGYTVATVCPHCGRENDDVTPLTGSAIPDTGDVSICWGCLGAAIFVRNEATHTLTVREATPAELADIETDDTTAAVRQTLKTARRASQRPSLN